jgi:short-subunit dehydrogenase
VPSLGLHHPEILSLRVATFKGGRSMGGRVTFPLYSIYHATKWAVEGFSESLAFELRPFGIRVRLVEPGAIRTEFYGRSREPIPAPAGAGYDALVQRCQGISIAAGREHGSGPEVVADTIIRAITDRGWRLRYPVAPPAPMLVALRKILPRGVVPPARPPPVRHP